MKSVATSLMFVGEQLGKAEEAMSFYASVFANSRITDIERYQEDDDGPAGSVKIGRFTLNGVEFRAMDVAGSYGFTFTPAISVYVDCESPEEIGRICSALSTGGEVLMPLDSDSFSEQFAWVQDRFGVSWQLSYG